ncbi:MAG: porin family protein [Chlorobiales bacterium]|nr:porin family protein [Chlorobiales bacterium]
MKKLFLALVLLFSAMMPSVSQAKEGQWSAAALAGYGFEDGYNFGLGARGGYMITNDIYVGGMFTYNLGKSEGDVDVTSYIISGEVGYNIPMQGSNFSVRPYVGLGILGASVDVPSYTVFGYTYGGGSESTSDFYLAPGVVCTVPVGTNMFVGADARYMIVSDFDSFGIYGTFGLNF